MTEQQKQYDVIKFDVTEAAIAKMADVYLQLRVKDVNDEEGFKAVHDARMVVVKHRTGVEKHRKALKKDALEWGRKVDAEAKKIFGKLHPIETHLTRQEAIVTNEKKRIEAAKAKALEEKMESRLETLAEYGRHMKYQEVAIMNDDEWQECIATVIKEHRIEQERLAEEKRIEAERQAKIRAEQEAERERLEKIRIEQEAEMKKAQEAQAKAEAELAEKQAKLEAEAAEVQAEKDRIEQARIDKENEEIAEQVRLAAEEFEKAEALRKAELKPDVEKAIDYIIETRRKVLVPPVFDDQILHKFLADAYDSITRILNHTQDSVARLVK